MLIRGDGFNYLHCLLHLIKTKISEIKVRGKIILSVIHPNVIIMQSYLSKVCCKSSEQPFMRELTKYTDDLNSFTRLSCKCTSEFLFNFGSKFCKTKFVSTSIRRRFNLKVCR